MIEGVALTGGMRTSLRQLTTTSAAIAQSTARLSTGLKIASGLDGSSYFAATGLRQRAFDLLHLKEAQSQVIATVKAADKGAASIDDLVQQARALAQTARSTAGIAGYPELTKSLASQFDTVIKQINAVAKDSSVGQSNLANGRSADAIVRSTATITGIDDVKVTNATQDANFSVGVTGNGGIRVNEADRSRLEATLGIKNVRATGFSSIAHGGFSDLSIAISGRQGKDRIVTVSDGRDQVSQKILYSDLTQGDQHIDARLSGGTRLDFDLNRALLDEAVGTGNSVSMTVRKRVDLSVQVTEANSGRQVTRTGLSDDERLADGENGLRFGDATLRLTLDEARINRAASRAGPAFSDAYGAAAGALVGKPALIGTPGAGVDQSFTLSVEGTGLDTARAYSDTFRSAVPASAQINQYSTSALGGGQSATITIDGATYTTTAGAGGLTAAQVAGSFVSQLGGAGLQVATGSLPANSFTLTAGTPGTGFSSAVSGGITDQAVQSNVAALTQVDRVAFTPTVELGETYGIDINGQSYSYTTVTGDKLSNVLTALAKQITPPSGPGGDPAVTAVVNDDGIDLTGKVPGVAFNKSASVVNLPFRLKATLGNGTASDTQNIAVASGQSSVTFNAALGNGVTGVTLNLDAPKLATAALKNQTLGFDVRFAQQGEGGDTSVHMVGNEAARGDVKVQLDTTPDSAYLVRAQNLSNDGLGLDYAANSWRDLSDIDKSIADCDRALSRTRLDRSSFGTSLDVLSNWDSFSSDISNVLNEGADKLTLLDQQEEGAKLLAEQTRYQFAMTGLSISNQFYSTMLKQMMQSAL